MAYSLLDANAPEQIAVRMFYAGRVLARSPKADPGAGLLVRLEPGRVAPEKTFGFLLANSNMARKHVWFQLLVPPDVSTEQAGLAQIWTSYSDDQPGLGAGSAYGLWRLT